MSAIHRATKIVATLGPSSSDYATIRALFEAGADVFRLNMSHGTHDDIRARHEIIRKVEEDTGRPICILADLQGPKLRVGTFANDSAELVDGDYQGDRQFRVRFQHWMNTLWEEKDQQINRLLQG